MKTVILAAGYGKRIGSITENLPKPLIPVVNKPILKHLLETICEVGLNDVVIVIGHLKEQILSFLSEIDERNLNLTIKVAEDFYKGPIFSFNACRNELKGEDFILFPSDFIVEASLISDYLQYSIGQNITLAYDDQPIEPKDSTVHLSSVQQSRSVLGFNSQKHLGDGELKRLLPLIICRTDITPFIKKSIKIGYTKVIEAIGLYLNQKNNLSTYRIRNGYWFDLDTNREILVANQFLLEELHKKNRKMMIPDKFKAQNICWNKPYLIGKNVQIGDNCLIGPNVSIGDNCLIGRNTKIQNSIVYPNSNVQKNMKIINAIFFKNRLFSIG